VPPEALNGNTIDDRSDVYAFGVCVYHWATAGRTLPPQPVNVEALAKDLPLKWTSWVLALLRMTLSLNPKARASSAEIKRFLSRRVNQDK
jgi:serine/threonine protein kinase